MNKPLRFAIFIATIAFFLGSCQYKFIVEPEPEVPDNISFSQQIAPIYDEQGCTACHNTNGQQPDLTAENAYTSLNNMGLINLNEPASSTIYVHPHPDGDHYAKYTSSQAALVLGWIEQGALDN
jgi:hypothetical protein